MGRWEEGKVKQMKDGEGKVGKGADGKMGRWEGASSASGDALSHLDTQEVISRMVPVVGLVVTIQKPVVGLVVGDNTQAENNSPSFPGGLVSAISPLNCAYVWAL